MDGLAFLLTLALAGQFAAMASQPVSGPRIRRWNPPDRNARPGAPRLHLGAAPVHPSGGTAEAVRVPLSYSTYFGGTGSEIVTAVAADPSGNLYLTGYTNSTDLPPSSATLSNLAPGACGGEANAYSCFDAFIAKLDPTGQEVIYLAYLGGTGDDFATSIAIDGNGNVYISGYTDSTDLPTVNSAQPTRAGDACGLDARPCFDAFVAKLNSDGSAWVYVTYLGGSGDDLAQAIAADRAGSAVITGTTTSQDFPTLHALQSDWRGGETGSFVAKIDSSGSRLEFSTFLGGGGDDFATSLALDPGGDIYLAGYSNSPDLPGTDSFQPANAGGTCGAIESTFPCFDAYVAKLSQDGQTLQYLTYLGGSGGDYANGIALDESGAAIVVGMTTSRDFPVTFGAFQAAGGGNQTDAFAAKLDPLATSLIYSTYLGGAGADSAQAIGVDPSGRALIAGTTYGEGFPVTDPSSAAGGFYDAFLAVLDENGSGLDFSTRLGGAGNDKARGAALDSFGNVVVAAETFSIDFPTANALQPVYGGGAFDGAVAKFALGEFPVLHASPLKVDFGQQHVATRSDPRRVVLGNIGAGELHLERLEVSGDFEAAGDCASLLPGQTCEIELLFAPSSKGHLAGWLTVFHDGLGETSRLELSGEGIAPEIRLSAATIQFDPQLVGTQSDPQEVALTNSGTAPLELSAISTSGNFIQSNNCPSVIPIDGQCTIRVVFSPSATGDQAGHLAVANSLPEETRFTSLTGSGTDFAIALPSEGIVVTAGRAETVAVTITPIAGFRGSVALACAGAPREASCQLAQQVIMVDGLNSIQVDLTVSTTARSAAPPPLHLPSPPRFPMEIFLLLIPAGLGISSMCRINVNELKNVTIPPSPPVPLPRERAGVQSSITALSLRERVSRLVGTGEGACPHFEPKEFSSISDVYNRRPRLAASLILLMLLLGAGCGGGGIVVSPAGDRGTPAGTYTLTLSATSGGVTKSQPVTLVVR